VGLGWSAVAIKGPYTVAALIWRAGESCTWCGRHVGPGDYHIDHLTPRARGGSDDATNLVLACPECNTEKYTKDRPGEKRSRKDVKKAITRQISIPIGRGTVANRAAQPLAERYFGAALEKDRALSRSWKQRRGQPVAEPWDEEG
jgi:hypothetical protein